MKLFFRVFLLIQLVTLPLRAQYMVQGVVTDSLTKEPLPYTSVYLKGTTEGGMTDNNGPAVFPSRPIARRPRWSFRPWDIMNMSG
mgnify:CR=1 FL=1